MQGPPGSRRYVLCFNGAIYNYVELAQTLGLTGKEASSDSAVLLAAWAAWGASCLPRLNGMYAFALWDSVERVLYLCRDRFGEKPLLYAKVQSRRGDGAAQGARLLFGSEAKALFASGWLRPQLDSDQLAEFLATHDIDHRGNLDGTTLFREVFQVPAGCYLRIAPADSNLADSLSALRPIRYFTLAAPSSFRSLHETLIEEARDLLADAVTLRLRSDVPVGGSLSGGLDSSVLTAMAWHKAGAKYRIFTCQFPQAQKPADESAWAETLLASLADSDGAVQRVTPSTKDFADDLEQVLFHQEAPFGDASICAHFAMMRAVQQSGVKVLLSGQGGDEVFAGYGSYFYALLGTLLGAGNLAATWQQMRTRAQRTKQPLWQLLAGAGYHALPAGLRQLLYTRRRRGLYPLSAEGKRRLKDAPVRFGGALPPLCATSHSSFLPFDVYLLDCISRWALPHILRQDDRNSMAFGIETRAPYLDHRLLSLLLQVEPTARIGDGYSKRLLREVGRGLLPEPVRLRIDKMGFFAPQRDWLWAQKDAVRAACTSLPDALAELTDAHALSTILDGFYKQRREELAEVVFGAFCCSVFIRRVLPRLADAGI